MKKKFTPITLVIVFLLSMNRPAFAMTNQAAPNLWESADYTIYADSVHYPMAGISYGPENLKDYNPSTAWVEGVAGHGYGQGLTIYPGHYLYLYGFAFSNGYNKSTKSRNENGSVYSFDFYINDQFVDTIYLSDSTSWQYYTHPTGFNLTPYDKIRLVITDVYVGPWDDQQDTALSDLLLLYDQYREPQPVAEPTQPTQAVTTNEPAPGIIETDTDKSAQDVQKETKPQTTKTSKVKKEAATIEVRTLITIISLIVALVAVAFSIVVFMKSKNKKDTDHKNDPFQK